MSKRTAMNKHKMQYIKILKNDHMVWILRAVYKSSNVDSKLN